MKFELVKYTNLRREHFTLSKSWAQYYEPKDINTLEKLGFNCKEVQSEIEKKGWSDEYWFPIPDHTTIGSFTFEHRLAEFETITGKTLSGYVVNSGHCICLFGNESEWSININLLDVLEEEIDELKADIGLAENEALLPIKTSIPFKNIKFTFAEK